MKKIGIFIGSMEGGGAERVVLNLSNEFQKRGVSFVLILRFVKGHYLKELNPKIKIIELNANNPFILIFRIIRVCKKNKIGTLLTVSRYNNVLGLFANYFLHIRIIIREASTFDGIFTEKKFKSIILLKLMKTLYPLADKIIANSIDTANDIFDHIEIPNNKLFVIYNPLVNDEIQKLSKEIISNEVFNKLTKPIVISVGRLFPQKNYSYLIRSFAKVRNIVPKASLLILGEGPLKNQLINQAKKLKIESAVHFLGFVDNPYKFLRSSDVFVLSSLYEGFGNVIVEALSVGLPVVSTNCPGGPREILNSEKIGELVPLNDDKALADAIIKSLKTKYNKQQLVERAKCFSIEKITDRYLEIIYDR